MWILTGVYVCVHLHVDCVHAYTCVYLLAVSKETWRVMTLRCQPEAGIQNPYPGKRTWIPWRNG